MYNVYLSQSVNPYFNLALEEYLVHCCSPEDQILFLWQNQNTVVIGRNQNPWKECNLEVLNRQEGRLVRRLSGGGAVYHDLGNLNFTFISSFSDDKVTENIRLILGALALSGIEASFSGKNDILAQGAKISGNAFFVEEGVLCHHGTLLVDADMEKLGTILTVSQDKLKSKGIESVKSRVVNLKALNPEISVETLKEDLIRTFCPEKRSCSVFCIDEKGHQSGDGVRNDSRIDWDRVGRLMKKYESWEWNFGESPEFNTQITKRFPWGGVDLYLLVKDGMIEEAKVWTDALEVGLAKIIEVNLLHKKFDEAELMSRINESYESMATKRLIFR